MWHGALEDIRQGFRYVGIVELGEAMQDEALYGPVSDESIRTAAEDTLREWPEAIAAVLFGSRARGDNRPDSDWDIAIMTRTAGHVPQDVALQRLDGGYGIQLVAMPEERMNRKCNAPGHIAFDIARHGRLLAGRWKLPPLMENPRMQDEEFGRWYGNAGGYLRRTVSDLVDLAQTGDYTSAELFVAASSQAAEHLVKGMICRHCSVLPRKTHDVESLARMLPEPLRRKAGELNGTTWKHHMADYVGIEPRDCRIAGKRTARAIELLADELVSVRHDPGLASSGERVNKRLHRIARVWISQLREPVDNEVVSALSASGDEVVAVALEQREILAHALETAVVKLE